MPSIGYSLSSGDLIAVLLNGCHSGRLARPTADPAGEPVFPWAFETTEVNDMKRLFAVLMSLALSSMFGSLALADDSPAECAATTKLFQEAGESASFIKNG